MPHYYHNHAHHCIHLFGWVFIALSWIWLFTVTLHVASIPTNDVNVNRILFYSILITEPDFVLDIYGCWILPYLSWRVRSLRTPSSITSPILRFHPIYIPHRSVGWTVSWPRLQRASIRPCRTICQSLPTESIQLRDTETARVLHLLPRRRLLQSLSSTTTSSSSSVSTAGLPTTTTGRYRSQTTATGL